MNSAFFANLTFVEMQARRIACRTDLYYITDTSRSGGEFSNQGKDVKIYAHNMYYIYYQYIIHVIFIIKMNFRKTRFFNNPKKKLKK